MSTKVRWFNGIQSFFESLTQETVRPMAPVVFYDDFMGRIVNSVDIWNFRDTNLATEAIKANAANGICELALTSANEVQLAGIDWNDQRPLVLNQGLVFEARYRYSVLPTGSVVACVGLSGNHNAAVDTVAESIWVRSDGNGDLTVENDDTVNETSKVATGITLTTSDWVVVRIDCTNIADVKFYINGNAVATGTTFNMSQVAGLLLQPVARIGKEGAAATVGTMEVDYIRCWQKRS